MDKIKPCPFCDGESIYTSKNDVVSGYIASYTSSVICTDCDAEIDRSKFLIIRKKKSTEEEHNDMVIQSMERSKKLAIDGWNRRSNVTRDNCPTCGCNELLCGFPNKCCTEEE